MDKSINESKVSELIKLLRGCSNDDIDKLEPAIEFLEDLVDEQNMDSIERYKKAYHAGRIEKCVEILIDIGLLDSDDFKRRFLLANALISPFSYKFNIDEYKKTMEIFVNTLKKSQVFNFEKEYIQTLNEIIYYTKLFYENNTSNTKRLESNKFFEFSLSEQLRMICIFLQDQSRLMQDKIDENIRNKSVVTGMEGETTFFETTYVPNNQSSASDGYEAKLEIYNVLIQYLYYLKKDELKISEYDNHGNIHPYDLPSFEELSIIAYQRMMYMKLEEKFRYSNWIISFGKNEYEKDTYLFEPMYAEHSVAHEVAVNRRKKQYINNLLLFSNISENTLDTIFNLSKQVDIDLFMLNRIAKDEYEAAKEYLVSMRSAVKSECKPYYLKCKIGELSVDDLLDGYEFLNIISKIYFTACMDKFNQDDLSCYKYLAPLIDIADLTDSFAKFYDFNIEKANNIISEFVYDENTIKDNGDIFTHPLIKVNKTKVILCQTLIEQMNMNRNIEKVLQRKKVKLNKTGTEYEKYLIEHLKDNEYVKVNTNKVEFTAYDGKNVEFDFLGVLNDFLLLIECKSVITPYGDKELCDRRKTIHEGVEQVLRRVKIVQNDWKIIREMVNIDLPFNPYPEENIIKIVCTDIYDFTTLIMDGVRITDDSVLLKYLTNPKISKIQISIKQSMISTEKLLWKKGYPSPQEFIEYLDNPYAVSCFVNCIHEHQVPIVYFKDDNCVIFKDMYLDEEPFLKNTESDTEKKKIKIYPNDKCSCGSGRKYKKCCGKKQ